MYGDFNETYRIIIANTGTKIHIVKRAHIFSGYKPYFVRPGHIYTLCQWPEPIISCMLSNYIKVTSRGK